MQNTLWLYCVSTDIYLFFFLWNKHPHCATSTLYTFSNSVSKPGHVLKKISCGMYNISFATSTSAQCFEEPIICCVRGVKQHIRHNGNTMTMNAEDCIFSVPLGRGKVSGALCAIPCTVRVPRQAAFSTGLPINLTPVQRHLGNTDVWAQVQLLLCRQTRKRLGYSLSDIMSHEQQCTLK